LEWIIWVIIGYGFAYWLCEIFVLPKIDKKKKEQETETTNKIYNYLNNLENDMVIAMYPYHAAGGVYRVMLETCHKVIFCFCMNDKNEKYFQENFEENYPYFRLDNFQKMESELNVNILIVNNARLAQKNNEDWRPDNSWKSLDLGNEIYTVYIKNI